MIIGRRKLKLLKLCIVSPSLEKVTKISILILIPLLTFYPQIQLNQAPINALDVQQRFQLNAFKGSSKLDDLLIYYDETFLPIYLHSVSQYIPITRFEMMQQRQQLANCTITYTETCRKKSANSTTYEAIPSKDSDCIEDNCAEFRWRADSAHTNRTSQQFSFNGRYGTYSNLGYYFSLNLTSNITAFFTKLRENKWLDQQTMVLIVTASVWDLRYGRQILFVFKSELPYDNEIIYNSLQVSQLSLISSSDNVHFFLFFYLVIIVILQTFRILMEIAYKFSTFALPLFQLMYFCSLYIYIFLQFYRTFSQNLDDSILLYDKSVLDNIIDTELLKKPYDFLQQLQFQIIHDTCLLIIWIMYPFKLLTVMFEVFPNTWYKHYFNSLARVTTSLNLCVFLMIIGYFLGFLPLALINYSQRNSNNLSSILLMLTRSFSDQSEEIIANSIQVTYFNLLFDLVQFIGLCIIMIYLIGVLSESFRKAAILELPYQSHHEKDMEERISQISLRTTKFFKEIIKLISKEKKLIYPKKDLIDSQLLDDEFLNSQLIDKKQEKILIVFEIHNGYLDEITRYQEKKDSQKPLQPLRVKRVLKKVGSIIGQLLQRNKNNNLSTMLGRYKQSEAGTYVQINDTHEEIENQDFLKQHSTVLEEQGITIRSFYILDQVVKFLKMLVGLRPEYLSPNAEQRIRIFFFINSQQVSEDDVYKMLSFLIVNLKNNHLIYPILIFSHHQDWNIVKDKYLILKKFYKNIFSTLDVQCALDFSLMRTSFLELQMRFAQKQKFQEAKDQGSLQGDEEGSSDEEVQGKSDME